MRGPKRQGHLWGPDSPGGWGGAPLGGIHIRGVVHLAGEGRREKSFKRTLKEVGERRRRHQSLKTSWQTFTKGREGVFSGNYQGGVRGELGRRKREGVGLLCILDGKSSCGTGIRWGNEVTNIQMQLEEGKGKGEVKISGERGQTLTNE